MPTGAQTERKISFVLHEPDNESENSSNTTVTMQGEEVNAGNWKVLFPCRVLLHKLVI